MNRTEETSEKKEVGGESNPISSALQSAGAAGNRLKGGGHLHLDLPAVGHAFFFFAFFNIIVNLAAAFIHRYLRPLAAAAISHGGKLSL